MKTATMIISVMICSGVHVCGQNKNIKSDNVIYDKKMWDDFYNKELYVYPWYIEEDVNGKIFSNVIKDVDTSKIKKARQNAKCFSTNSGSEEIKFCHAWKSDDTVFVYINDVSASMFENLIIAIKNNKYSCWYWTSYPYIDFTDMEWRTRSQRLTLKYDPFQSIKTIYGKIEYRCDEIVIKTKKHNNTIDFKGVFSVVMSKKPENVVVPDSVKNKIGNAGYTYR